MAALSPLRAQVCVWDFVRSGPEENCVHGQARYLGWYHKEMDGRSLVLDRLIRRIRVLLFPATYPPSVASSPCLASQSAASRPSLLTYILLAPSFRWSQIATLAPPRSGTAASFGLVLNRRHSLLALLRLRIFLRALLGRLDYQGVMTQVHYLLHL